MISHSSMLWPYQICVLHPKLLLKTQINYMHVPMARSHGNHVLICVKSHFQKSNLWPVFVRVFFFFLKFMFLIVLNSFFSLECVHVWFHWYLFPQNFEMKFFQSERISAMHLHYSFNYTMPGPFAYLSYVDSYKVIMLSVDYNNAIFTF